MSWLLLLIFFWKPIWWTGRAIYHLIRKEDWDYKGYLAAAQGWFKTLWELVGPGA